MVSIAVFDDDTDGGHDHIGTVTFTPSKSPGYNGTATAYTENITGGYARLFSIFLKLSTELKFCKYFDHNLVIKNILNFLFKVP